MNTSLWYGGSSPHQPVPPLIPPVPPPHRPEHVAAHHAGADILECLVHDPRALVHLAAPLAMRFAPGGQRNGPVMQPLPALAERVLLALVGTGYVSIQGHGDVTPERAHRASSVGGLRPAAIFALMSSMTSASASVV